MKLTNTGKTPRGLFNAKGQHVVIAPGETVDHDFAESKHLAVLIKEGHLTKGAVKEAETKPVDLGFVAAHHSFGDWTVKDKDGNRVNGTNGEPLLFKKDDGDAKASAEAAAAVFNAGPVA